MEGEAIKALVAKRQRGSEPNEEELAAGVMEAVDIVLSIAASLERIAKASDRISKCEFGGKFQTKQI